MHLHLLERERQKLSAVVNHADAGFVAFDGDLRLVWSNAVFGNRYGAPAGAAVPQASPAAPAAPAAGTECHRVLCGQDRPCDDCPAAQAFAAGRVAHREMKLSLAGHVRHIYATAMPIRSPDGTIEESLVMLQDVSDLDVLRRSQEALRVSESRFRSIFENASTGMSTVAPDGTLLQVNRAFCRFVGRTPEELTGASMLDITHPDDRSATALLLKPGTGEDEVPATVEKRYLRKDGTVVWGLTSATWLRDERGRPDCAVTLVQDVDERKRTEELLQSSEDKLRQSQKMEAIGRLAGGVAHDFNNLLTVITGRCDLLLRRQDQSAHALREVEVIRDTADRAAALTRQLLAFSRKQVLKPRVIDLNAIIADMESMLHRLIGEDVRLISSLRPDLGMTRVDPSQMEQIIMNLAINARDAMPDGGRLTIETDNVVLGTDSIVRDVHTLPGSYVLMAVSDTGTGMDAPTRGRIFEPFFTTKGPGKGTGLGLSTVYGIVKQSGGYIFVYSEPDMGATFKIYLPRVDGATESAGAGSSESTPRGTGTILLVEDEGVVRDLAKEILEQGGYTVLAAGGAAEAHALCAAHKGPIDLLLTDVVMPETGGRALAAALTRDRPGMRVLYMSGYSDEAVVLHGVLEAGTAFLQKPFTPEGLARKVRETLDGRTA